MKKNIREMGYKKPRKWVYDLGALLLEFCKGKIRVEGAEKIPEKGPMLILANHTNYADPVYLAYAFHKYTKSRIHLNFMMLDDFFGADTCFTKGFNKLANLVNSYQVNRERITKNQRNFFKNILLDDFLAIFFTGTRSRDGRFNYMLREERPPTGIIHLAELAQKESGNPVKILPVAITYNVLGDITISFGKHRTFKPRKVLIGSRKKFAEDIINTIGYKIKVNLDSLFANYLVQYAIQHENDSKSAKLNLSIEKCQDDLYSIVTSLSEKNKININMALLNDSYFSDNFFAVSRHFKKKKAIEFAPGGKYIFDKEKIKHPPYIAKSRTKDEVKEMRLTEKIRYLMNIRIIDKNMVYNSNKIIHLDEVTEEVYKRVKES